VRILWVKAGGLVPPETGGRIRSYNILKRLARRHDVTIFTFYRNQPGDQHAELKQMVARLICMPMRLPASHTLSEALLYARNMLTSQPYAIAKYCRPEVAMRLRKLLGEQVFDVMVCDFVNAGGVIPWEAPCTKILFTHNVEAMIWRRHFQNARNPFWKAAARREYRATDRVEQAYLRSADHVLAVSEVDRKFFSQFIEPSKITVIPTGVDIDFFEPAQSAMEGNILVFTGSMDWIPNDDAIFYFVKMIFPLIQMQIPDTELWIVGRSPSPRLRDLGDHVRGIRVTGRVDDIRPYVRDAAVCIVPLRIGGGTRLKIFEAMAMGKAVVSTTIGAEGLPVQHGKNILLADQPQDFADNVVSLLKNPLYRENLGRAARYLVEKEHSWDSVASEFENALAKVSGLKPEPPTVSGSP
jgi:sugar transferase (PEP-CTERM/EpsH1 system associated)